MEIDRLTKEIRRELKKPEHRIDIEKIKANQNKIIELERLARTDREELDDIVASIRARQSSKVASDDLQGNRISDVKRRPRAFFHGVGRTAVRLAVGMLVVGLLSFSAFSIKAISSGGFHKAWVDVNSYISELLRLQPGSYDADGVTIQKGRSRRYDSLEEMLRKEKPDILYPLGLPEHIRVTEITIIELRDDVRIELSFNVKELHVGVRDKFKKIDFLPPFTINGMECYLDEIDGIYQIILYHEEKAYIIQHTDYDELMLVVSHLKALD